MKPLDDQDRQLAEAAATVLEVADRVGLPDPPDKIVSETAMVLMTRAYVELRQQLRALHDLIDLTDPNDPIGAALTKVGLSRRPPDRILVPQEPRLVRSEAQVEAMSGDDLLALYCGVMHEPAVFFKHESYVVRLWDGMDHCWTDCTEAISRDDALRVWAKRTNGGSQRISFAEIDYYRIFPGGTRMRLDGSEEREMNA